MENLRDKQKLELMGTAPIGKLILQFAAPSVLGMLAYSLYNIVDRIFVGHYVGVNGLAATGVCYPYMILGIAIGTLAGVGAAARISILLGEDNIEHAETVFGNGLLLASVGSALLLAGGIIYADAIIRLSGGSAAIQAISREYFDVIVWGSPLSVLTFALNGFIRAEGRPRYAMCSLIVGALSNIGLDALFIITFGWGVRGAALATIFSQALSMAWITSFYALKKSAMRVRVKAFVPRAIVLWNIITIGFPSTLTNLSFTLLTLLFTRALSTYGGELGISAFGIFMGWDSLLFMPSIGIGEAVQPLFGYNYGAGLVHRVDKALKYALMLVTGYFIISAVAVRFFTYPMVSLFTTDELLIPITVDGMRISYSCVVFAGATIVVCSYLQGLAAAKMLLWLTICRHFLFPVPSIMLLPRFFGLKGVWGTFAMIDFCGGVLAIALLIVHEKYIRRRVD